MTFSREKKLVYMREYNRKYNRKNREKVNKLHLARIKELTAWVRTLRKACVRCGEDHPACLDFHHIDPSKKVISIANAVRSSWSKERLLTEIAKCEVLCSNCHRKETLKIEVEVSRGNGC